MDFWMTVATIAFIVCSIFLIFLLWLTWEETVSHFKGVKNWKLLIVSGFMWVMIVLVIGLGMGFQLVKVYFRDFYDSIPGIILLLVLSITISYTFSTLLGKHYHNWKGS